MDTIVTSFTGYFTDDEFNYTPPEGFYDYRKRNDIKSVIKSSNQTLTLTDRKWVVISASEPLGSETFEEYGMEEIGAIENGKVFSQIVKPIDWNRKIVKMKVSKE